MLDARTRALVRRAAVGQGAGALAVDERTGHVFVQNVGENTVSMLDARSGVLLCTITLGDGPSILAQARTTGGPLPTTVVCLGPSAPSYTNRVCPQTPRAICFQAEPAGYIVPDARRPSRTYSLGAFS